MFLITPETPVQLPLVVCIPASGISWHDCGHASTPHVRQHDRMRMSTRRPFVSSADRGGVGWKASAGLGWWQRWLAAGVGLAQRGQEPPGFCHSFTLHAMEVSGRVCCTQQAATLNPFSQVCSFFANAKRHSRATVRSCPYALVLGGNFSGHHNLTDKGWL